MDRIENNTLIGLGGLKGVLVGNITLVPGIVGKALYLNGVDQAIELGSFWGECFGDLSLCVEGYTIAFWFKYGNTVARLSSGAYYYIAGGGHTRYSHGIAIFHQNGLFAVWFRLPNGTIWTSSVSLDDSLWNHVTVTWKLTHGLRVYLNGIRVEVNETPTFYAPRTQGNYGFDLGRSNKGKTAYGECVLDELYFWEKRLEDDAIRNHYGRY